VSGQAANLAKMLKADVQSNGADNERSRQHCGLSTTIAFQDSSLIIHLSHIGLQNQAAK
jgi:hypothetical protein